jgi:hypothetical protein
MRDREPEQKVQASLHQIIAINRASRAKAVHRKTRKSGEMLQMEKPTAAGTANKQLTNQHSL